MTMVPLSRLLSLPPHPGRVVALDQAGEVSFERFRADVATNTARLAASGCRRGALVCRDSYWLAVGLFALLHAGVRPVMPSNLQLGSLKGLAVIVDCIVGDGDDATFRLEPAVGCAELLPPLDARAVGIEFFTSGSTGEPKPVNKPLLMLEREVAVLETEFGCGLGDAWILATVPHHHVYGLTFKVLWPLCAGRPFVRQTCEHWEAVAAELPAGAVLVTSPSHLTRIAGMAPFPASRRPRLVLSAGAPLPTGAACEAATVLGVPITEIFGSSETGVIASRRCDGTERPWRNFPGVEVTIADDRSLCVRSPFLAEDGWYVTGDVAEPTADSFRLLGRADRIVKIEGKRINLADIERLLRAMPLIQAALVTMLPGEPSVPGAVVVLTEAGRAELSRLGAFRLGRVLRRALSSVGDVTAMPRRWRFPDRLPSDAMGKQRNADIIALFNPVAKPEAS
ncbi:MAG: AMP-binding protein [Rhodospirillaceae bacterium]